MSYECIYCEAELIHTDTWGVGHWYRDGSPEGEILQCPNHQGFEDEDSAFEYWNNHVKNVHSEWEGFEDGWNPSRWDEISCESDCNHVSGMFYTDRNGDLYEGYPC